MQEISNKDMTTIMQETQISELSKHAYLDL